MSKSTNEDNELIEEKMKYIGLDLKKIPSNLINTKKIGYRHIRGYNENNIYKFINIEDIEILLTPLDKFESIEKKYKESYPLYECLNPEKEENIEKYITFLNMIRKVNIDKIKKIEEQQKEFRKKIPYEVNYKESFIWQIYYSDIEQKYFMIFSTNDENYENIFYIIKKKIEQEKNKSKEKIYVPINYTEYSNKILKKSEIADLINYLWLFTGDWARVYEIEDIDGKSRLEIVGETIIYEKIKSIYKIVLEDKKLAQEQFNLIKALFILQSHNESEYKFKTIINENGSLSFCYNMREITYKELPDFIKCEAQKKIKLINDFNEKEILEIERLELLKKIVDNQNKEYLNKEGQIASFLECKKTFLGRVSYYFRSKKKIKINKPNENIEKENNELQNEIVDEKFENKEAYTIEDLLKISEKLNKKSNRYKNMEMDIKALEGKKESLERKIKNATLYINEIESHKKSIFDFWKFTNKDEKTMLTEGEKKEEKESINKIKKQFIYEEDIEEFSKKIDSKQREILSKNECDAIFAIREDIESFNIINKEKILKKEEKSIDKKIQLLKQEYEENEINQKDFDIFGNVTEDKTKIKILNSNKHREIEKNKYNILELNENTNIEEYKETINKYLKLLNKCENNIEIPYDMSLYISSSNQNINNEYYIFNLNSEEEIEKIKNDNDIMYLHRINMKEKMNAIFFTNIMFYDNLNNTLPLGMDLSTQVLVNMKQYDIKLISRKDININYIKNTYDNEIKKIQIYEYNIERKI